MGKIKIRVANNSDVSSLVKFNQLMAWETEQKKLDQAILFKGVSALVADDNKGFYLVAEQNDEVVGSLMVTTEWSDWRNGVFWWVQSVYITVDFRRQGIYAQLYAQVKALAEQQQNVCGFRLYVEKENIIAQKTYESLGMQPTHYLMYEE
ncbi:GNAT family N-acetyltransferase [Paraglaciecola arctica]|uniref:GCN5-related N-acetyltransferase n=1 Tax=Paraglaciecola arctica BSs20135 TaxID=493475 RepID=K6Z9I7_9ALTE|nr:GNAT family N-acetyltransferase [Paraglaciecola arctica]GAC20125.1 GCN5-related N-acetyltransferase [Paraglaciecola arctica BSs20135]